MTTVTDSNNLEVVRMYTTNNESYLSYEEWQLVQILYQTMRLVPLNRDQSFQNKFIKIRNLNFVSHLVIITTTKIINDDCTNNNTHTNINKCL